MANLTVFPGFVANDGRGMLGATILSLIATKIQKGDDDPLSVKDIARQTGETLDQVMRALRFLDGEDFIRLPGIYATPCTIDEIEVSGFRFELNPLQNSLPGTDTGKVKKRPKANGYGEDTIFVDGIPHTAKVEPGDDGAWLTITRDTDDFQVVRQDAVTPQEAWNWCDRWAQSQAIPTILSWATKLPGSGDTAKDGDNLLDVVYLDERTFDQFLCYLVKTERIDSAQADQARIMPNELIWSDRYYMGAAERSLESDIEVHSYLPEVSAEQARTPLQDELERMILNEIIKVDDNGQAEIRVTAETYDALRKEEYPDVSDQPSLEGEQTEYVFEGIGGNEVALMVIRDPEGLNMLSNDDDEAEAKEEEPTALQLVDGQEVATA